MKFTERIAWILTGAFVIGLALMLSITMLSCSPQKRLYRLVKKHPELMQVDTLVIRDTVKITVPAVQIDTFTTLLQLRDTVYFEKDFVKVKVWERNDSIFIVAKTDTIYRTVYRVKKVPYNKIVVNKEIPLYKKLMKGFFILWLMFLILLAYKKSNSPDSKNLN